MDLPGTSFLTYPLTPSPIVWVIPGLLMAINSELLTSTEASKEHLGYGETAQNPVEALQWTLWSCAKRASC